ncbi:hypothetical protein M422DRAFT_184308, partial [Sphaerobolus stellatus SS14]
MPWPIPEGQNIKDLLARAEQGAKDLFGYDKNHDWQLEACRKILEGCDTIVSAPTGGGKSLTFVLPLLAYWNPNDVPNIKEHVPIILIIAPLVSLMEEQAAKLNAVGIPAVALCGNSLQDPTLLDVCGKFRVGLMSPETVIEEDFASKVSSRKTFKARILTVCYDESHTIIEWGGSFRPDYLKAAQLLRGRLPSDLPVLLVSATLSKLLVDYLQVLFNMSPTVARIEFSNARPNISLCVCPVKENQKFFAELMSICP